MVVLCWIGLTPDAINCLVRKLDTIRVKYMETQAGI